MGHLKEELTIVNRCVRATRDTMAKLPDPYTLKHAENDLLSMIKEQVTSKSYDVAEKLSTLLHEIKHRQWNADREHVKVFVFEVYMIACPTGVVTSPLEITT